VKPAFMQYMVLYI